MNNKSNKIRQQRKLLAYSIRELAALANILEKDIIAYEANKKVATLKTIEKISNTTNTKVSDWVAEDYFSKSKYTENISYKSNEEIALCFFRAMFRADGVMDTLYSALLDMKEIEITENEQIVFSEFTKEILISMSSIKLKKIFTTCKINEHKEPDTNNFIVERNNLCIDNKKISIEMVTFDALLQELKVLFKDTDIIDVIIQALINIGTIDSSGYCSEKANLLLNTILSSKIKNSINKNN